MTGYEWTRSAPPTLPADLPPVHRAARSGLDGALVDGVGWMLREAGLLDALEQVTGDADALHAAAGCWLAQASSVRAIGVRLRQGAAGVAAAWDGEASAAFGAHLGRCVAALDALAVDLAGTALILNRAGLAAGLAEDLVTGIVAEAAEWAAAELAATAVADLLTLGLASIAGAVAESATLAAFTARAGKVSADLGRALAELAGELRELARARDAIHGVTGRAGLRELRNAQATLDDLRLLGHAYRALNATADAGLGRVTGLPLAVDRERRLAAVLGRTVDDAKDSVEALSHAPPASFSNTAPPMIAAKATSLARVSFSR